MMNTRNNMEKRTEKINLKYVQSPFISQYIYLHDNFAYPTSETLPLRNHLKPSLLFTLHLPPSNTFTKTIIHILHIPKQPIPTPYRDQKTRIKTKTKKKKKKIKEDE